MEVSLTAEQQDFVHQAVKSGRYGSPEDAVRDALNRWEAEERMRAEIGAALDEAEADLEAGRYRDYSDSTLPELARELKSEGRVLREDVRRRRGS